MRKSSREIKYLTKDEVSKLLGKISDVRDKAIFTTMYYRGLRASEIGLLEIGDVRMDAGRIYVRRVKGSLNGEFIMLPPEVKAMKAWLAIRNESPWKEKGIVKRAKGNSEKEVRLLFPSQKGGPINRRTLYTAFKWYGESVGIPSDKLFPHTLKHSIATHLLDAEEDITTVKDWLGHKQLSSTEIYAQVTSSRRDNAAKRVYKLI